MRFKVSSLYAYLVTEERQRFKFI